MKVSLTSSADADLLHIHRRMSAGSPRAAAGTVARIGQSFSQLADFPFIGRPRPRFGQNLRSLPVGLHIVFYKAHADEIRIIRGLDGRRDVEAEFDR